MTNQQPAKPRPYRLSAAPVLDRYLPSDIAVTMGVSERTVQRWRHEGISGMLADRLAVKVCGLNPQDIWGREWEASFDREPDMMDGMSDTPTTSEDGEQFDGTADDVVMPDDVRRAAEARVAAAVEKYGASTG